MIDSDDISYLNQYLLLFLNQATVAIMDGLCSYVEISNAVGLDFIDECDLALETSKNMSTYPEIEYESYEKGLSIFLLCFVVLTFVSLFFWLWILWISRNNGRYKTSLKLRYTHIVLISYAIIA